MYISPKSNSHYALVPRTDEYIFNLRWKVFKDKSSQRSYVGRLFQRRGLAAVNASAPRCELVQVTGHLELFDDRS